MFLSALFFSIVTLLGHGTYSYEDCKELDFKPKACFTSEALD
jgi:hypothetical protein